VTSLITQAESGVAIDRRLGARMMVRVSGELEPSLALSDLSVEHDAAFWPWSAGSADVTFTLTNTGNTRIDAAAAVSVSGLFGLSSQSVGDLELPQMLPGTEVTRTVRVADLQ